MFKQIWNFETSEGGDDGEGGGERETEREREEEEEGTAGRKRSRPCMTRARGPTIIISPLKQEFQCERAMHCLRVATLAARPAAAGEVVKERRANAAAARVAAPRR